ncbi:hypothetical protein SAMN02745216_04441 [Desulfatibacillum alkenivorans DSM 16219]|jgi:hypothetical protein|uniref:AAA+ ATPase domain-containing protein n=1 Tax=Desulfatibacillum alkenivorans DSM 16219 TaxID=1121393 RepID=A0A1M6X2E3_9BACT|nr:hypothetical protein [Desulfatibacillum alkenivorans]SHL00177.1 hypothetical protein SAMN02745216_04441 [Desulfatibacillum alkenivorans DSM 16219]
MKAHDNPFASRYMDSLPYIPIGTDWERILGGLKNQSGRGAVVGPKGTGKTTFLEELKRRLSREGYTVHLLRLNQERKRPDREEVRQICSGLDLQSAVLLDGAEQLSRLGWISFVFKTRKAGILVASSHSPGLLPTLLKTTATPELLQILANRLLPEDSPLEPEHSFRLFHARNGNLRLALMDLYDIWARR